MCQAFELDRGMVPQAGMNAFLVVEALDVSGDRGVEYGVAGKGPLVRQLGLERVKEALHVGVVLAIARPVHAGHDAASAQEVLVAVGRVFDSPSE